MSRAEQPVPRCLRHGGEASGRQLRWRGGGEWAVDPIAGWPCFQGRCLGAADKAGGTRAEEEADQAVHQRHIRVLPPDEGCADAEEHAAAHRSRKAVRAPRLHRVQDLRPQAQERERGGSRGPLRRHGAHLLAGLRGDAVHCGPLRPQRQGPLKAYDAGAAGHAEEVGRHPPGAAGAWRDQGVLGAEVWIQGHGPRGEEGPFEVQDPPVSWLHAAKEVPGRRPAGGG
mmetsp:Transcript_759/g.2944  ORF Transcript_759/g.2944 Transcript_759/m.2944 type:complete len:227 (+) Transcript_759:1365-2045(+)